MEVTWFMNVNEKCFNFIWFTNVNEDKNEKWFVK